MTAYLRCVALNDRYVPGYYNLGVAMMKLGYRDLAKAAWQQALALDSEHRGALQGMERLERRQRWYNPHMQESVPTARRGGLTPDTTDGSEPVLAGSPLETAGLESGLGQ